jgi:iron complex outermembrane receptor protein
MERVNAPLYFRNPPTQYETLGRLFAHAEWRVGQRWLLQGGAMVENDSLTGTEVAPRIAANYHLTPQHTLRVSLSSAERTPVLFERAANFRLNLPPLFDQLFLAKGTSDAEHITSAEIGYVGEIPRAGLKWDLKLYEDHLRGLISTAPYPFPGSLAPNTLDLRNRGNATVRGVEAELVYQPTPAWKLRCTAASTSAKSWPTDGFGGPSDVNRLARSTPQFVNSVLAIYTPSKPWTLSAGYYQVSAMEAISAAARIPPQRRLDVRLAYRPPSYGGRVEVVAVVQSLLDSYEESSPEQVFKRRALITLRREF